LAGAIRAGKRGSARCALDAIGIKKGDLVADVGAGVGYFTWRMSERVGPTGKVYANDIQPRMLEQLKKNIASRGLTNVVPVLGAEDDPKLPAAGWIWSCW